MKGSDGNGFEFAVVQTPEDLMVESPRGKYARYIMQLKVMAGDQSITIPLRLCKSIQFLRTGLRAAAKKLKVDFTVAIGVKGDYIYIFKRPTWSKPE